MPLTDADFETQNPGHFFKGAYFFLHPLSSFHFLFFSNLIVFFSTVKMFKPSKLANHALGSGYGLCKN
jgi:hypothetical protein